jgi:hypothetical protein
MSRLDFTTTLPSSYKYTSSDGINFTSPVGDDKKASEVSSPKSPRTPKPKGWVPPKPYSMTYRKYQRAQGICRYDRPFFNQWNQYEGCVGAGRFNSLNHFDELILENLIHDSSLKNLALQAARLKLKRTDVNLGVAYVERKATANLLGDTATRLAKSFRNLRSGRIRNAMNDLGISSKKSEPRGSNVPNQWLALQYGWKPFLSDVYGSCKALEREPNENWRVTAKSTKQSLLVATKHFPSNQSGDGRAESKRSNFTRIDALPGNELLGSLASLGITNPLLIAWELVPYSFVVDWVFPIGSWLESIDALLGYESAYYSSSDLTRCDWEGVGTSETIPGNPPQYIKNTYQESKRMVVLTRTVSDNVPLPTFPRIKDPSSLGHMANGLALLAGAFGRR